MAAVTHVHLFGSDKGVAMSDTQSRAKEIFLTAATIVPAEQRQAYIDAQCGDDEALRREVEQLLAHHAGAGAGGFLESPAVGPETADLDPPILLTPPGTVIGRYKLLEPIGEGGYGVVFMAEQTSPVQRRVALKIVKAGMDTKQVIARFEAERQALALMDHPNIAKVFDAGVTETGRPYFVMELVKGVPITKYCDEHRLTPRDRLELFMQVCNAVQHAHQKGIIHRDLKPSNVLIAQYDGKPVPKVIDFGVAKATGQQLTARTMFTGFGDVIGTPEYMSPEQAELNQLDIDTRSDIYSLGVLLYELLTGTTPIDHKRVREAALLEVLRVIREEEPPKPSTRLSTVAELPGIAAQRGLEPKKLSGLVHGELDWIVMKALEKDRSRRYETANGFALDVQRYLRDEAVQACPPSAAYRFRKFTRRHRTGLLATAAAFAVLLVLMIGLAISNRMIAAERNEKAKALEEKERALAVAETQRRRAEENFRNARIAVRDILIRPILGLSGGGEWSRLPPALRKQFTDGAIKFYETLLHEGDTDPSLRLETAVGYRSLGTLYERTGVYLEAEKFGRQSIAILEKLSSEYPDVLEYQHQLGWSHFMLAWTFKNTGRLAEAETAFQQAASIYEKLLARKPEEPDYRSEMVNIYANVGHSMRERGRLMEAERAFRRSIEMYEMYQRAPATDEKERPDARDAYVWSCSGLMEVLVRTARTKEAVELAERAIAARPGDGFIWNSVGVARYRNGQWKDAILALEKSMELRKGGDGNDWFFLAMCHWQLGEKNVAREWYDKAAAWMEKNQPNNEELRRFRREAEELMKIAGKQPTTKKESTTTNGIGVK
jgi:serine/threonine protein kinase